MGRVLGDGLMKKTTTSSFGTTSRINHDSDIFYNSKLYQNLNLTPKSKISPDNPFPQNLKNKFLLGDSSNMKQLLNNSLHLMITSPPYNVSKEYDENLSLNEYLKFLKNVFTETYRVLVNGGRACINVANVGRKPYIPLSDYISKMMINIGFMMRGEIIWNKAAGAGTSTAWGSWQSASNPTLRDTHEYILIFSKNEYKRKKENYKQNTIKREEFMEWTKSIWTMNPESARKIGHPAPFPVELPYRLIQLYSFTNDIILDPFMGSGTTGIAALKANRYYIGYENNQDYVDLAQKRVDSYKEKSNTLF